jgi:hypothetical protein
MEDAGRQKAAVTTGPYMQCCNCESLELSVTWLSEDVALYLESSETGAAIWEFTSLPKQLRAILQAKMRKRRRYNN